MWFGLAYASKIKQSKQQKPLRIRFRQIKGDKSLKPVDVHDTRLRNFAIIPRTFIAFLSKRLLIPRVQNMTSSISDNFSPPNPVTFKLAYLQFLYHSILVFSTTTFGIIYGISSKTQISKLKQLTSCKDTYAQVVIRRSILDWKWTCTRKRSKSEYLHT